MLLIHQLITVCYVAAATYCSNRILPTVHWFTRKFYEQFCGVYQTIIYYLNLHYHYLKPNI